MDESQMKTLPAESRETAQSFRKMYTEEKDLKAQGPEAILKHAEQKIQVVRRAPFVRWVAGCS